MRNVVFMLGLLAAAPITVTVVFESGSRATVDKMDKVIDAIQQMIAAQRK